ncbi:hypothetical protein ACVWXO_001619 [Bradyrhizobium sp. LM2.7]
MSSVSAGSSYPPLEGEGRSRAARAGWGDLSKRAVFRAERPSPHPGSHFAALNASRPSPLQGRVIVCATRYTAAQTKPLPLRLIFPTDGEGKCAVQHSVSVSQ